MQINNEKTQLPYAGFGPRVVAFGIDCLIIAVAQIILLGPMSDVSFVLEGGTQNKAAIVIGLLEDFLMYIPHAVYFVLCTYFTGTTVGKRIMNLRVVNKDGTPQLSLGNVIYRETVGRFLCKMSIGIGYLIAGFEPEKRGLHDILCDTQVICARKVKVYEEMQKVSPRIEYVKTDNDQEDVIENPDEDGESSCEEKEKENPGEKEVLGGYHLTDETKVDIVDEENISENDL